MSQLLERALAARLTPDELAALRLGQPQHLRLCRVGVGAPGVLRVALWRRESRSWWGLGELSGWHLLQAVEDMGWTFELELGGAWELVYTTHACHSATRPL